MSTNINNCNSEQYMTMSIASLGECTIPKPNEKPFEIKKINDISDISGAKCGPKYKPYINKPLFLQSDVNGSTSKSLTWSRNVRDNQLYIDDIDGTRHAVKDRMMRTERHVDPLAPNYHLPAYVPIEYPVPKFIKDPLDISDIDGTRTMLKKQFATRDTMKIDDIDGSRSKKLISDHQLSENSDVINSNISKPNHRFKDRTNRVTDPNKPFYHINGMDYHDDAYTRPKKSKAYITDNHLLQTKDITGAVPGWHKSGFERREYKNTNYIHDIPGTQADSIKHSIQTNRETHPLAPVYQSLDPGQILEPLIPPLIPPSMIKVPTVPIQRSSKHNAANSLPNSANEDKAREYSASKDYNIVDEYDPVCFVNPQTESQTYTAQKPPSGRQFNLDLYGAGRKVSEFGNSPYMSARQYSSDRSTPNRMTTTAANTFSNSYNNHNGFSPYSSARLVSNNNKDNNSARGNSTIDRKASLEREAEINSVRSLRA